MAVAMTGNGELGFDSGEGHIQKHFGLVAAEVYCRASVA